MRSRSRWLIKEVWSGCLGHQWRAKQRRAGLRDLLHMPVICAATPAQDIEIREVSFESRVLHAKFNRISRIEIWRFVEFRMAAMGGVSSDSANPDQPFTALSDDVFEVGGMSAVDHVICGMIGCGLIDLPDCIFQRLTGWKMAIHFDCKGNHNGHSCPLGGMHDSERFFHIIHRNGSHQIYTSARKNLIELNLRMGQTAQASAELESFLSYLQTSNNRARAAPFIEELLAERPNDSTLLRNLAQAYYQAGRIEDAVAKLDSLAEALLDVGKKEEAMVVINQILLMNAPNSEQYRQLLMQLQQP